MKALCCVAISLACVLSAASVSAAPLFGGRDVLAPRDDWGVYHRMPVLNETDFAGRERLRLFYYSKSGRLLTSDPAYMGSVQVSLQRWGYYCGPIDGIFTDDVSDAIARMQKAYGMRVTGTLTVPVRRALFLP